MVLNFCVSEFENTFPLEDEIEFTFDENGREKVKVNLALFSLQCNAMLHFHKLSKIIKLFNSFGRMPAPILRN